MFSWLHVVVIEIIAMLISSPLQRSCELKQLQFTYFLNDKCTALSGNTQVLLSWLIKEVFLALIPFHVGYPAWDYNTFWQGFMNIHPESKLVSGLYAVSWAKAFVFKSFLIRNEFLLQQEGNLCINNKELWIRFSVLISLKAVLVSQWNQDNIIEGKICHKKFNYFCMVGVNLVPTWQPSKFN